MKSTKSTWLGTAGDKLRHAFAEREIFYRSHGQVHFIRISSRAQKFTAALALTALAGWGALTLAMAWNQASVAVDRQLLADQQRSVASQVRTVDAYKRSVGEITQDLDRRQDMLDELVRSQFGGETLGKAVVGEKPQADNKQAAHISSKISTALPAVDRLHSLEQRQLAFARNLAELVDRRATKAEAAIRSFGLNPRQIALHTTVAQGGPYIPWSKDLGEADEAFSTLATSLARLNALERGLAAIPSGRPTTSPELTSSYGYRRDPFTRAAAFHAGLDFPGAFGQPILAAAPGRVSFVGRKSGYGNCVEVEHGNDIMTRYAHLSGFNVRAGQQVPRGAQIARMGSTGRSTGTHLHFEVRVNGAPINPRRFLEANQDVLQVQKIAKQRVSRVDG